MCSHPACVTIITLARPAVLSTYCLSDTTRVAHPEGIIASKAAGDTDWLTLPAAIYVHIYAMLLKRHAQMYFLYYHSPEKAAADDC